MFIYDVNAEIQRKGNSYLCIYVNGKDFFSSHSRNRKIGWALFNPLIKLNFNSLRIILIKLCDIMDLYNSK